MNNLYEITFDTKKGGCSSWIVNVEAKNLKEAKQKAEEMWRAWNTKHMFHIKARRLKDNEEFLYYWFKEISL